MREMSVGADIFDTITKFVMENASVIQKKKETGND